MKIKIILLLMLTLKAFSFNFTNVQTLQKSTPKSEFGHSAPILYDFDDDGQKELWIGSMEGMPPNEYGTIRIYPATSSGTFPTFDGNFNFASVNGTRLKLLAWT